MTFAPLSVTIALGNWETCREAALPLRFAVFVDEQGVPAEMEVDEWDELSLHALARDVSGQVVGTARLLPDGHIGRMAVSQQARGQGVGGALLTALMDAARQRGERQVKLNAQLQAVGFYKRHGFECSGEVFDDAGLPHIAMQADLARR